MRCSGNPRTGFFIGAGRRLRSRVLPVVLMLLAGFGGAQAEPFSRSVLEARAKALAQAAYRDGGAPEAARKMTYDEYRRIRFLRERSLPIGASSFQAQFYHPGWLFGRSKAVHIVRDGKSSAVRFAREMFDYDGMAIDDTIPAEGFAGFRLLYPMNDIGKHDEVISFLGASYFRFIGPGQRYGLSARGLAIAAGDGSAPEEFPHFTEFWVEEPGADDGALTIHALLDSPSVTGAYSMAMRIGERASIDVDATLFARVDVGRLGVAPLTSMFYTGPADRRRMDEFRSAVHDSDALLVENGRGETLLRLLRNPASVSIASFFDDGPRGFGLLQRERSFGAYQDLEAHYHLRPGYYVTPLDPWGKGAVRLVELPVETEMHDNVVAFFAPEQPMQAGQRARWRYRLESVNDREIAGLARVVRTASTFRMKDSRRRQRYVIDFSGGELSRVASDISRLSLDARATGASVTTHQLARNSKADALRAVVEIEADAGAVGDVFATLRMDGRPLSETWVITHAPLR